MENYSVRFDMIDDELTIKDVTGLDHEQQSHFGSFLYLLSAGVIDDQITSLLVSSGLPGASETYEDLLNKNRVNDILNEDVISPHEVLDHSESNRSYSAPVKKPEKIVFKAEEIDLSKDDVVDDDWKKSNNISLKKIYSYESNFRLTKGLMNKLIEVDGVEIIQPLSRYRVLIAFGSAFDESEVKFELFRVVDDYLNV